MTERRHRSSYQFGWRIGREDYDQGMIGDALSAWLSIRPRYRNQAPDLMSFTEGYARGSFMSPKSADQERRRSSRWLEHRSWGRRPLAERDPDERFPASAGPWLDVYFENTSAARRFAEGVRKVFGYRATVDERNPRKVTTNLERWQFSDLMQRLKTRSKNAPLRIQPHEGKA